MTLEKLIEALLSGGDWFTTASTVAVAVLTFLTTRTIWLGVERWMAGNYERRVFIQELEELVDHLGANIVVLSSIDLKNGWPSTMHIAKCKVPEGSMLFDLDSFRKLRPEHATTVYHAKLVLRNLNIEADAVIERCVAGRVRNKDRRAKAIEEMPGFVQYLIVKQINARRMLEQCIEVLRGSKIDVRYEKAGSKTIVYE